MYEPSTYSGAPDECSIHWPTKLVDGRCPIEECPWNTPVPQETQK